MTELEKVTATIEEAESTLKKLQTDGASEGMLISFQNYLVELQKEKTYSWQEQVI